jgi:hypothetical protein
MSTHGEKAVAVPAAQLTGQGLPVRLDAEWRAAVIELEAVP